jgi:hypothetical protein
MTSGVDRRSAWLYGSFFYTSLGARLLTVPSQTPVLKKQKVNSKVETVATSCIGGVSDLYRAGNSGARD